MKLGLRLAVTGFRYFILPPTAPRMPHTARRLIRPRLPEKYIPHRFPEISEIGIERMSVVLI